MRIIISPAKKMKIDQDSFPYRSLPQFLLQTEELRRTMQAMSMEELKKLWKCNDQIAALNFERLKNMDLRRNLTPALLSYVGIQYQYMAPSVFTEKALEYASEHLRILSGFYGVLRPFDGVTPYRLEMQTKLNIHESKNLYNYWNNTLAENLFSETDCIINLASKEYSSCISQYVPAGATWVTCVFAERKGGILIEKGTLCKMARGEMVRFMAEENVQTPKELTAFDRLGYRFSPDNSNASTYVFIKTANIC